MATVKGKAEPGDASIKAIASLGEGAFLRDLNSFPYLSGEERIKERLRTISKDWKKKVESKESRETTWEYILYLVHLCPRLLDLPEFVWLKEKFYGILMMRLWSSEHDKSYWAALERVRKDFTPSRPKTPERKFMVARRFEYHRNLWVGREISKTCRELLEVYRYKGRDEEVRWVQLLRRIKIPRDITARELERLNRINEEIKGEGDYIMLPYVIQSDLIRTENERAISEGERFWAKIWKPISKKAKQLKLTFIDEVTKDTSLAKETIRKLLRQAAREVKEFK